MTEAGITPYLDQPWRRFAWIGPLAIVFWGIVLVAFAFLLEQTAAPPQELKPVEARIVELPPTAGLQGGAPAAPAGAGSSQAEAASDDQAEGRTGTPSSSETACRGAAALAFRHGQKHYGAGASIIRHGQTVERDGNRRPGRKRNRQWLRAGQRQQRRASVVRADPYYSR